MGILNRNAASASPEPAPDRERYELLCRVVTLGVQQFEKVGRALTEIRDSQLYRCQFATFEECCLTQWQMSPRHAERLIDAADVCRKLRPIGQAPANEHQARLLGSLPEAQQADAWREAITNGGTAAAVKDAVAKRKPAKTTTRLRPTRLRVPGATIVIEPNRRFQDLATVLRFALAKVEADSPPHAKAA